MIHMSERSSVSKKTSPNQDFVEIKFPKFKNINPIKLLVLILLAFAFFSGYQTAKVTYWEQKEKTLSLNAQGAQPTPTPSFYKVGVGHLPLIGKADAKVTIVEFSDLQCLFCRRFWKDTLPQIKKDYIDKGMVKFAYRHFPLPESLHPAARPLAEASECANEQDKFWEFHDIAYQKQQDQGEGTIAVSEDDINNWAGEIGLDQEKFQGCFNSKKYAKRIDQDLQDGQAVNVNSTPTFYINGQIVVGAVPYATMKTIIDEQLKK